MFGTALIAIGVACGLALDVVTEQCQRIGRTTGWLELLLDWLLRNREEAAVAAEDIVHTTTTPVVASLAQDILDRHARQRHLLRGMAAEQSRVTRNTIETVPPPTRVQPCCQRATL